MAITNFIPTIWSESLLQALDQHYVGVANCTREFEGEIREKGSRVKICGLNAISIDDYSKNTDMSEPSMLTDACVELVIDQAKYFNFQIDDVDLAQGNPHLMELALKNAAAQLSKVADTYVYSLVGHGNYTVMKSVSVENILDVLIDTRTQLLKNGVSDPADIIIEVTPEIAAMIMKAKIDLATDNTGCLEHGYIGNIGGSKIFVTPHLHSDGSTHVCAIRTRRAIAFAEQLSEVEAYRPERRFADAMKGLHLYGASVVRPDELVELRLTVEQA